MANSESCYKDFVFRVSANESAEPCQSGAQMYVVLTLYGALSLMLFGSNAYALLAAYLTPNRNARRTLLLFCIPSLLSLVLCLIITIGTPLGVRTGEDGYGLVVLFGMCLLFFVMVLKDVGVKALDRLAEISLKSVDENTRAKFKLSPGIAKAKIVLEQVMRVWNAFTGIFLCILFPLSKVGTARGETNTRQFWWDMGLFSAQFLSGTTIMLLSVLTLYVIAQNLKIALATVNSLIGNQDNVPQQTKEYREQLTTILWKIRLAMFLCIPTTLMNWSLVVVMSYIANIEPKYYLVWLFFAMSLLFAQIFINAMFRPKRMLDRLLGRYESSSSNRPTNNSKVMNGSKLAMVTEHNGGGGGSKESSGNVLSQKANAASKEQIVVPIISDLS